MKTYFTGLILVVVLSLGGCNAKRNNSNSSITQIENLPDSCKKTQDFYTNLAIRSEGLICNGKRQGIWKDWYADGTLMDSGLYKDNRRIYDDTLLHRIKGVINFKGNPSKFFIDSTYFFAVTLNMLHNYNDIETFCAGHSEENCKNYEVTRVNQPIDSFCFS